jgi:hypothetical protein
MALFPIKPSKKISQKILALRASLFPHLHEGHFWNRLKQNGFTSVPRTMPLLMGIMDDMAGMPVGMVYLELWSRAFDEGMVNLAKQRELAFHSGLTGQRADTTWRQRVRKLAELGFIEIAEGSSGELSQAVIINPYLVIRKAYKAPGSHIPASRYNALIERMTEIDAKDMELPDPWLPPPAPSPMPEVAPPMATPPAGPSLTPSTASLMPTV